MVHIHALVFGEYVDQRILKAEWSRAVGEKARVHVRAVRGADGVADALREVLKYATKGEKGARTHADHAAAVEIAFRNVHRVALGGAVRRVRIVESAGATEDVRDEDLHDRRVLSCEECGVVGEWKWIGIVSEALVIENGGFGLLRWWRSTTATASG
jgi:hypothetical protein